MIEGLKKGTETQKNNKKDLVEFTCKVCGKTKMLPEWVANNKKYCSTKCAGIAFLKNEATQSKIKESNLKRIISYRANMRKECVEWVLNNKEIVKNCPFNKISSNLGGLLKCAGVEDYRSVSKSFGVNGRKELLKLLKKIVDNGQDIC